MSKIGLIIQKICLAFMEEEGYNPKKILLTEDWIWDPDPGDRAKASISTTSWIIKIRPLNMVRSILRHGGSIHDPEVLAERLISSVAHEWRHYQQERLLTVLPRVDIDNYSYNGDQAGKESYQNDPGERDARQFADYVCSRINADIKRRIGRAFHLAIVHKIRIAGMSK